MNNFFDAHMVQKGISTWVFEIPKAIIQIIIGSILLCLYHPFYFIFSLLFLLIFGFVFINVSRQGLDLAIKESENKIQDVDRFEEIPRIIYSLNNSQFGNMDLLKSDDHVRGYLFERNAQFNILLRQFKTLIFLKSAVIILTLILGLCLVMNKEITVGQFIATEMVILIIVNSLDKIVVNLEYAYDVITSFQKIARAWY